MKKDIKMHVVSLKRLELPEKVYGEKMYVMIVNVQKISHGKTPKRVAVSTNMIESIPSPTRVLLIVRSHNHFPAVNTFNFARTRELLNSPTK